jgi:hypothetical protein
MSAGRRRLENAIQIGKEIDSRLDERYAENLFSNVLYSVHNYSLSKQTFLTF